MGNIWGKLAQAAIAYPTARLLMALIDAYIHPKPEKRELKIPKEQEDAFIFKNFNTAINYMGSINRFVWSNWFQNSISVFFLLFFWVQC